MLLRLWNDEVGFVISFELMLVATILVIGMIVGLVTIRDQLIQELGDVAAAIAGVNQSYSYSGITGHFSSTAGSNFVDRIDACQNAITDDPGGAEPMCIELDTPATPEA
jgi:hypothetical protein